MTAAFKVIEAVESGSGEGKSGPWKRFNAIVTQNGSEQVRVSWFSNKFSPAPVPGQSYQGTVEKNDKGYLEFRHERKQNGFGGGQRGRSPEDRALDALKNRSIMSESALKSAVEYAAVLAQAGRLPDEFDARSVVQVAGVFWNFIDAKTKEAG